MAAKKLTDSERIDLLCEVMARNGVTLPPELGGDPLPEPDPEPVPEPADEN